MNRHSQFSRVWSFAAATLVVAGALPTARAVPTVGQLSLRGLQTGATTTLAIDGADLGPESRLVLPVPIASQTVKPSSTATRLEVDVTLDAAVRPGIYNLRVANSHGISNAVLIGIDQLAERPFAADAGSLPVALNGSISGGTILRTSFEGQAGQSIVIDVESHRIGSKLDPVIHLSDSRNAQLAWSQRIASLGGDARIVAKLPAAGRYTVELHDALYRGAEPGAFRLKIGELHLADLAFPLGGQSGASVTFALVGANAPAEPNLTATLPAASASWPAPWPAGQMLTGTRPQILVADVPSVVEPASDARLTVPTAIEGRLLKPQEQGRYLVAVTPGETLRFDVISSRAGAPLDGVLAVLKESGEQLAAADDGAMTTDPTLDFKIPDGVGAVVVTLKDLLGRGGPEFAYRILVTKADRPDFRLELLNDREQVPLSGAAIVRVRAARNGYQGPIKLSLPNLPPGIAISQAEIPAGATDALVSLTATGVPAHAVTEITGSSTDASLPLVRVANGAESPASKVQPWLRSELAIAVTNPAPLTVAWEAATGPGQLPLGSRLPAKVRITRAPLAAGAVRLVMITSQITPKKEVTENNQKRQVDDEARALRFDGVPMIAADQVEVVAGVLVPGDLPNIPYDLAIRAELLAADGKTVVASAVTPARRLTTTLPLHVDLAGEPKVDAKAGSGATGQLTGKVQRIGEFSQPVTITLAGLPADYLAPSVVLAPDASDFALPVSFPFNAPVGPLADVRLVATAQANGSEVRSNEVPVSVNIVAGGPPPALYRVFEDEPHFVGLLNEGGGKASLESTDRYAGAAALHVTPDQKFRVKLPGLGVRIKENPGEGEFRYLRYAWKKVGGGNILLQLNANGQWGPVRGENKPSYRYEAGPANNPFNAAAIKVAERLPYGWTLVTRDLFADFGEFQLDGLAFTPGDGEAGLFDQVYLARSEGDFKDCPPSLPAEQPLAVFEDQPDFVAALNQGAGSSTLATDDKFTGESSIKVLPEQVYSPALSGLGVKIRQNPGPGEYRYLQFAWKKQGGQRICLQLNHDGQWGPVPSTNPLKFRYDAGPAPGESYGGAKRLDGNLPAGWTLVTRDLFADFGEFTLNGMALSPSDGDFALFDHIYLGRTPRDLDLTH